VENTIKQAHDELKESRAQQAEARLKYLLSQSDIFSHFGLGKGKATAWTCDLTHGYIDINGSYRS